jgi:hypothetical protein
MAVPADPAYYSTAAQVIPTLLLAAAVEHRFLAPDSSPPDEATIKQEFFAYLGLATLTVLAAVGAYACVDALYSGPGTFDRKASLVGLLAAFALVVQPLVLRSLLILVRPWDRVRWVVHNVLPFVVVAAVLVYALAA